MKLYLFPPVPNSFRIIALLTDLGVEAEIISVNLLAGETRTESFLAINPLGTVPTLVDGDLVLWESRPIMGYLASMRPDAGLYPDDPAKRAMIDQWMYWEAFNIGPALLNLGNERVVNPLMGRPGDSDLAEKSETKIYQDLPFLEASLQKNEGVAGDISIADYLLGGMFGLRNACGLDLSGYDGVNRWLADMESRKGFKHASAISEGFLKNLN